MLRTRTVWANPELQKASGGKHARSKAHTKMGVGPTREVTMKSFAKNEVNKLYFTDYLLWWNSLRNEKMASEFLGDLIYFCIALHDNKQKKLRKSWFNKAGKLSQHETFALVRRAGKTIHYITCCYKVAPSKHLTQAIADWHEVQKVLMDSREKTGANGATTVIDSPVVLHSILMLERSLARSCESDAHTKDGNLSIDYWRQCIVPRVIECTFIGPEDPIVGQSSDGTLADESTKSSSGDSELDPDIAYCFSSSGDYPYVLTMLQEVMTWSFPSNDSVSSKSPLSDIGGTSGAFIVYETMGKLLKRLPSKMRINPIVARNTLLSIIHLFRRMLERYPILDFDFIVSIHETMMPYLRWAAPYCTAVTGFLQTLEAEAASPGASLRKWQGRCRPLLGLHGRALRRCLCLSKDDGSDGTSASTSTSITKNNVENARLWNRLSSTMFIYYDGGSPLACMYANIAVTAEGDQEKGTEEELISKSLKHDLARMQRDLITESIDSEFELIAQRTATTGQEKDGYGMGIDDVYIDGDDRDPLKLKTATSEQLQKWYDVCSAIMVHDFGRDVGTCQEWRPGDAYTVKRCRRAALSKLVKTIDSALNSNARVLVVREDQNLINSANRNDSVSTTGSDDSIYLVGMSKSNSNSGGKPVRGRSSFSHALSPVDPKLSFTSREYLHLSNSQPSSVVIPPTLSAERLLGFDDESSLLLSTVDSFVQGCYAAISASGGTHTLLKSARDADEKIIKPMSERAEDNSDLPFLRLCAMGNGKSFHQFVMAYVRVVSELRNVWSEAESAAESSDGVKGGKSADVSEWKVLRNILDRYIRVYIVPIGRDGNDLASWLAHRDGWYRKTVYSMFRTQPEFAPALHMPRGHTMQDANDLLRVDSHTKKIIHDESKPPLGYIIPSALMDYGMNARKVYPVTLFRCECWTTQATMVPGGYGEQSNQLDFSEVCGSVSNFKDRQRSLSTSSATSNSSRPKSTRIRDSGANLVVPFATRVEIGMPVMLREYMNETEDEVGEKKEDNDDDNNRGKVGTLQNGESYETWREQTLMSKEFHAWWNKKEASLSSSNSNATHSVIPCLSVKFTENDMNGEVLPLSQEQALSSSQYVHMSISTCFRYTSPTPTSDTTYIDGMVPCSPGTNPLDNSVGVRCVPASQQLTDMLKKKKWNSADILSFKETLCNTSTQHHAGIIEVESFDRKNGFSILLDGALYGPFSKIRISPCTDRTGVPISMPIASYT